MIEVRPILLQIADFLSHQYHVICDLYIFACFWCKLLNEMNQVPIVFLLPYIQSRIFGTLVWYFIYIHKSQQLPLASFYKGGKIWSTKTD